MTKEEKAAWDRAQSNEICFHCRKSIGLCEWSDRFEPVKGWKARKIVKGYAGRPGEYDTYKIYDCPKFEEDE